MKGAVVRRVSPGSGLLAAAFALTACGVGTATLRGPDGALAPCESRRCVSSLEPGSDSYVDPLRYGGTQEQAHAQLLQILTDFPRVSVVTVEPGYIYAQVTTPIMEFVDDMEFAFGEPGVIHVRSSGRIGYYDLDSNRERVQLIRAMFSGER